jgi:hypothetical protein
VVRRGSDERSFGDHRKWERVLIKSSSSSVGRRDGVKYFFT